MITTPAIGVGGRTVTPTKRLRSANRVVDQEYQHRTNNGDKQTIQV